VYYEGALAYYALSNDAATLNHAVNWGTFHSGACAAGRHHQCRRPVRGAGLYRPVPVGTRQSRSVLPTLRPVLMQRPAAPEAITGLGSTPFRCPCRFSRRWKQYSSDPNISAKCTVWYNYPKTTLALYNTTDHLWWRDATFKTAKSTAGRTSTGRGKRLGFCRPGAGPYELPVTGHAPAGICDDVHGNGGRAQGSAAYRRFLERKPGRPHAIRRAGSNRHRAFHFWPGLGVNNGLLVKADYLPAITKAWKAIADTAIFSTGALGYVQGSGSQPGDKREREQT